MGARVERWADQIAAWHRARVTNDPTEAINNLSSEVPDRGVGKRSVVTLRLRVGLDLAPPT